MSSVEAGWTQAPKQPPLDIPKTPSITGPVDVLMGQVTDILKDKDPVLGTWLEFSEMSKYSPDVPAAMRSSKPKPKRQEKPNGGRRGKKKRQKKRHSSSSAAMFLDIEAEEDDEEGEDERSDISDSDDEEEDEEDEDVRSEYEDMVVRADDWKKSKKLDKKKKKKRSKSPTSTPKEAEAELRVVTLVGELCDALTCPYMCFELELVETTTKGRYLVKRILSVGKSVRTKNGALQIRRIQELFLDSKYSGYRRGFGLSDNGLFINDASRIGELVKNVFTSHGVRGAKNRTYALDFPHDLYGLPSKPPGSKPAIFMRTRILRGFYQPEEYWLHIVNKLGAIIAVSLDDKEIATIAGAIRDRSSVGAGVEGGAVHKSICDRFKISLDRSKWLIEVLKTPNPVTCHIRWAVSLERHNWRLCSAILGHEACMADLRQASLIPFALTMGFTELRSKILSEMAKGPDGFVFPFASPSDPNGILQETKDDRLFTDKETMADMNSLASLALQLKNVIHLYDIKGPSSGNCDYMNFLVKQMKLQRNRHTVTLMCNGSHRASVMTGFFKCSPRLRIMRVDDENELDIAREQRHNLGAIFVDRANTLSNKEMVRLFKFVVDNGQYDVVNLLGDSISPPDGIGEPFASLIYSSVFPSSVPQTTERLIEARTRCTIHSLSELSIHLQESEERAFFFVVVANFALKSLVRESKEYRDLVAEFGVIRVPCISINEISYARGYRNEFRWSVLVVVMDKMTRQQINKCVTLSPGRDGSIIYVSSQKDTFSRPKETICHRIISRLHEESESRRAKVVKPENGMRSLSFFAKAAALSGGTSSNTTMGFDQEPLGGILDLDALAGEP